MWQTSLYSVCWEGLMSWSSFSCSSTSALALLPHRHLLYLLLYKCVKSWHPAEYGMGYCPGGTLSAPTTPLQHVLRWVQNCTHRLQTHTHSYTHVGTLGSLRRRSACLSIYFSSRQWELWIGKCLTRGPGILLKYFSLGMICEFGEKLHSMTALSSPFGCHHQKKERKKYRKREQRNI